MVIICIYAVVIIAYMGITYIYAVATAYMVINSIYAVAKFAIKTRILNRKL